MSTTTATTVTASTTEDGSLVERYDGLICDLDGVVYRGELAIPGAVETLNRLRADDVEVAFATNNASRAPETVGEHLEKLGLAAGGWSVVTSSQAAAAYLRGLLPPGTSVLAVGGPGVALALEEAGLAPLRASDPSSAGVEAIVQGIGLDVTWSDLAEIGYLVQRGAIWVATNLDPMRPTSRGPAPGNGALVAAVRSATSTDAHVVGKPGAALFELAMVRLGTGLTRTLVCGDRIDTDIAGANAAGMDSLLVLSGACDLRDLAFAPANSRPTYVAAELTHLLGRALRPATTSDHVELAPDGALTVHDADPADLLRSVIATVWAALDDGRTVSRDRDMWHALEQRLGLAER